MKIGIITYHSVHNHGAILQLYALKRVLESRGHYTKALDFKRNYDFIGADLERKYSFSIQSIPYYIKYLFKNGLGKTLYNYRKSKILKQFTIKHNAVGEYYTRANDLDGVFIGSDEVFSIEIGLNPCMWGFGVHCPVICSYAASFGPTNLDDIYRRNVAGMLSAGLGEMARISVRDQNTKAIVNALTDKECTLTCDPVILLGYTEELCAATKPVPEKYIIVYSYDANMNHPSEIKSIRHYADSIGAHVYSIGYYHSWCDRSINVDPFELLSWIKFAEQVITDTFHGSVLSIISNSPFVAKVRGNAHKMLNLLNEYGLSDRLLESIEDLVKTVGNSIDWGQVNEQILTRRAQSIYYLESCLGEMKHG